MEYFDDVYGAIRQIKFQILCEYEVKTSETKIQALSEDLSQILWYTFSQKWDESFMNASISKKVQLYSSQEKKLQKSKIYYKYNSKHVCYLRLIDTVSFVYNIY